MVQQANDALSVLRDSEKWWAQNQKWFEECGYMLRPRYRPGWVPSWIGKEYVPFRHEDDVPSKNAHLLDGTRMSDGKFVMLKMIETENEFSEFAISQMFSQAPLAADPRNHCVPVLEVLRPPSKPNTAILVLPLLLRYNAIRVWDTFGEIVQFVQQLLEGLQFMHENHVAHRDCCGQNVMMDAPRIYPEPWHPQHTILNRDLTHWQKAFTRTQSSPVRYLFIDFGISYLHVPSSGPPIVDGYMSADQTAPEYAELGMDKPHDPFPTDIYYLGNLFRREFTTGYHDHGIKAKKGCGFLEPLITKMVQDDPSKRPTIDEAVDQFDVIVRGLSTWKLRSRVAEVDEDWITRISLGIPHWRRRIYFMWKRVPPIPS